MKHQRIFTKPNYRLELLELANVSGTAGQWDFVFGLSVDREVLRSYTLPPILDDEGFYLVGGIVRIIDAALDNPLPRTAASHGKYFSFEIEIILHHRRRPEPETLALQILIGPCDSDSPVVYVLRIEPPF